MMEMLMARFAMMAASDCSVEVDGSEVLLQVHDFEGFDARWREIEREFEDEDALDAVLEFLSDECDSSEGDGCCTVYHFGDVAVVVQWDSAEI